MQHMGVLVKQSICGICWKPFFNPPVAPLFGAEKTKGVGEAEVALRLTRKIGHVSGQPWVKQEPTRKHTKKHTHREQEHIPSGCLT